MLSTMPTIRGWQARTILAPAAASALAMNQAKLSLSPTPVTRATWPLRSIGVIVPLHEAGDGVGLARTAGRCNGGGRLRPAAAGHPALDPPRGRGQTRRRPSPRGHSPRPRRRQLRGGPYAGLAARRPRRPGAAGRRRPDGVAAMTEPRTADRAGAESQVAEAADDYLARLGRG